MKAKRLRFSFGVLATVKPPRSLALGVGGPWEGLTDAPFVFGPAIPSPSYDPAHCRFTWRVQPVGLCLAAAPSTTLSRMSERMLFHNSTCDDDPGPMSEDYVTEGRWWNLWQRAQPSFGSLSNGDNRLRQTTEAMTQPHQTVQPHPVKTARGDVVRPEKDAVERRAVDVAMEWCHEQGWPRVEDVGEDKSWDLEAYDASGGLRCFVEVKGTTGAGTSVTVTGKEVKAARRHGQATSLVVVTGIQLRTVRRGRP